MNLTPSRIAELRESLAKGEYQTRTWHYHASVYMGLARTALPQALDDIDTLRADLVHAVECKGATLYSGKSQFPGWEHYPAYRWEQCPKCQRIKDDLEKR